MSQFYILSPNSMAREVSDLKQAFGFAMDLDGDSLVVTRALSIRSVVFNQYDGTALVEYERLASTKGRPHNRTIIKEQVHNETVEFRLVSDGCRWRILDPPAPRVSQQRLLDEYREDILRAEELVAKGIFTVDHPALVEPKAKFDVINSLGKI